MKGIREEASLQSAQLPSPSRSACTAKVPTLRAACALGHGSSYSNDLIRAGLRSANLPSPLSVLRFQAQVFRRGAGGEVGKRPPSGQRSVSIVRWRHFAFPGRRPVGQRPNRQVVHDLISNSCRPQSSPHGPGCGRAYPRMAIHTANEQWLSGRRPVGAQGLIAVSVTVRIV